MGDELSGKVAIEIRTVAALLGAGATVAALDRDEGGVGEVVEEGPRAAALPSRWSLIWPTPSASRRSLQRCARIDILVSCAGVAGRGQTLLEFDQQDWDLVHTVNLKAPLLLMKHVARHMIERGAAVGLLTSAPAPHFARAIPRLPMLPRRPGWSS
jgi:NAD(P)-dependent dehydrogenase (short-subunit alcohol dehydrogenase family)